MLKHVWAVFILLFLLALASSLIALASKTLRPKAKWAALASAIGLVVSVVFPAIQEDERQAREMGFLSAADRHSAERAVADAARRATEEKAAEARRAAEEKAERAGAQAKADAARRAAE